MKSHLDYTTSLRRDLEERKSGPYSEITLTNQNIRRHDGLKKGFEFLHKNRNRNINVMDVSVAAGLSRRGLYKAFATHVGVLPGQILRQQRLERATDLLCNSDYNLAEIAKMSGYHNANSFWVAFRNSVGVAPGQFRTYSRSINVDNAM